MLHRAPRMQPPSLCESGIVCGFAILNSRTPPMRMSMKFDGFRSSGRLATTRPGLEI
jgi:hypothetical protein